MENTLDLELSRAELSLWDRALYMRVWRTRSARCECCGQPLYEPRLYMFHHILEKRKKNFSFADYTMYRHCAWNILLLCWQCHDAYERNPLTRPFIMLCKLRLLSYMLHDFAWDERDIWLTSEVFNETIISQLFGGVPIQNKRKAPVKPTPQEDPDAFPLAI